MYKIGIVGHGVVGRGIHRLFGDQVCAVYDPSVDILALNTFYEENDLYGPVQLNVKEEFTNLDLVVIAVPTPSAADGSADVSAVWSTLVWLSTIQTKATILIKSTTPPTELREMEAAYNHIVFSPEYMGESKYFTPPWKYPDPRDMKSHTFQIFGGQKVDTSKCVDIFMRVMGPHVKFYQTDIATAGLVKYMENSYFAMKVTFCNEWYDIAQSLDVDYNELRELWLADPRVEPMHTMVMPKDRGYGGKCYPKDTKAIIKEAENHECEPKLMKAMDEVNDEMRGKNV